jgi:hypothetical protein
MLKPMSAQQFEFGYTFRWYHRNLNPRYVTGTDWSADALYLGYGITDWFTTSIEGLVYRSGQKRYPEEDYRRTHLGGGMRVTAYSFDELTLNVVFHYSQFLDFDRSRARSHFDVRSIVSGAAIVYTPPLLESQFSIGVMPSFVYDEIGEYTSYGNFTSVSSSNFGVLMGVEGLLFHHVRLFGDLLYASYWQPRIGVGLAL